MNELFEYNQEYYGYIRPYAFVTGEYELPYYLTLYQSMVQYNPFIHCYMLCVDDVTYRLLEAMEYERIYIVQYEELEQTYPALQSVNVQSSLWRYALGMGFLVQHICCFNPSVQSVQYCAYRTVCIGKDAYIYDDAYDAVVGTSKQGQYNDFLLDYLMIRNTVAGRKCIHRYNAYLTQQIRERNVYTPVEVCKAMVCALQESKCVTQRTSTDAIRADAGKNSTIQNTFLTSMQGIMLGKGGWRSFYSWMPFVLCRNSVRMYSKMLKDMIYKCKIYGKEYDPVCYFQNTGIAKGVLQSIRKVLA